MKRSIAVLFAVVTTMFSTAAPAAAAEELGISSDGVTFTPTFHGPLFDSAIRWVPGDSRDATFYVRNQGGATARMSVDILGDHVGDLLGSGDLTIMASAGGETGSTTDGEERRLITLPGVAADEIVPVTISVDFDFSAPNDTQLRSSDLNFRINLSQTSAVLGEGAEAAEDDDGLLPDTGARSPLWLAALAAICIGSGAALISRRRTHTEGASHG